MTVGRISGVPDRLVGFADAVQPTLGPLRHAGAEHAAALAAFRAAANDLGGPALQDLAARAESDGEDLGELAAMVAAFGLALGDVDRLDSVSLPSGAVSMEPEEARRLAAYWAARLDNPLASEAEVHREAERILAAWDGDADARAATGNLWDRFAWPVALANRGDSMLGLGSNLARTGVHSSRWALGVNRVAKFRREWYGPHPWAGSPGATEAARRAHRQRILTPFRQAHTERLAAKRGFQTNRHLTGLGRRFASSTSTLAKAARGGARVLGGAGLAYGGYDTVQRWQTGDTGGAIVSGVATAGGVMMMFPPTAVAGGFVVVGALVYEHREEITDAARWVGGKLSDGASWTAERAGDAVESVGGAVANGATRIADTLGGLFGP